MGGTTGGAGTGTAGAGGTAPGVSKTRTPRSPVASPVRYRPGIVGSTASDSRLVPGSGRVVQVAPASVERTSARVPVVRFWSCATSSAPSPAVGAATNAVTSGWPGTPVSGTSVQAAGLPSAAGSMRSTPIPSTR